MMLKNSLFAFAAVCAPFLATGCSGSVDPNLETESIASELHHEVERPFFRGTPSGMTSGNWTLVDTSDDGLLGWQGPMVTVLGVPIQQPAFIFEHGYAAPKTATATLIWQGYTAQEPGMHSILAPAMFQVAGTVTVSGLGESSSAAVVLIVEALVGTAVRQRDSVTIKTLSASTGQRSASFTESVTTDNVFDVNATTGEVINYRARLELRANTRLTGKARMSIKTFGAHTNQRPNTDTPITILRPI